ncbi:CIC_collapsed_G0027310.mRNA.1.CDS.1 [Saccharomyces cerevisiae]|nr:CIC_collapsed_G0027310.mRNA.1.CDS.1 [Saccharomyces cerevisiae]
MKSLKSKYYWKTTTHGHFGAQEMRRFSKSYDPTLNRYSNNVTHNFIIYPINYCTLPPLRSILSCFDISSRLSRLPFPLILAMALILLLTAFITSKSA